MGNQRSSISKEMRDLHVGLIDNVIPLPMTGRKEPPNGDWLSELSLHTTFLARTINFTPVLDEYTIMGKRDAAILLRENRIENGENASNWTWHDPIVFCRKNEKVEILD